MLWDLRFRRNLQDWEVGDFQSLIGLLRQQKIYYGLPGCLEMGNAGKRLFLFEAFGERGDCFPTYLDMDP